MFDVPCSSRQSAFTLVELLVVLVIIGFLAGMGLTAMQHIGRAQALNSAARQFANDINMARNYAVSSSKYVYLIVAPTNYPDYAFTAYAFCTPSTNLMTQAVLDCSNVVFVTDVQYLPKGVVFDINSGTNGVNAISKPTPFPSVGGGTNLAWTVGWVVTFTPNGQVLPLVPWPSFKLLEGIATSPTSIQRTGVDTNSYTVSINTLIGKPIVSR